ncbi:hypothetical protein PLICRDRAFT_96318 [Plicaturopsis crispa FD-325 SS-3]|nr:hypothetical protein PLICRDRAFT_96318 [Plicaturopsis crispa FD-325 SS-3]
MSTLSNVLSDLLPPTAASSWLAIFITAALLTHIAPYLYDAHGIRTLPGPFIAKFSDFWLGWAAGTRHRSEIIHEAHHTYGTFVRIAPNHTSIASPEALQTVYAHGNGVLKTNFYDAFVSASLGRALFNIRGRSDHSRKRKMAAHAFSSKSVAGFEPYIRVHVEKFAAWWDSMCAMAAKGMSGTDGKGGWTGRDGRLWLDCLPCKLVSFASLPGDLITGAPFGMLDAASDSAPIAVSHMDAMNAYGEKMCETDTTSASEIFINRGEVASTLGVLPPWTRPLLRKLPWFNGGKLAIQNLSGLSVAAVARRLADTQTDRPDLLTRLQEGRDEEGNPLTRAELTSEASSQLTPGCETISNTACATIYYLARDRRIQIKLQKELDAALSTSEDVVPAFELIKRLPYLEAVIQETFRVHSTASLGLPRVIPEGGLVVLGKAFPEGAIVSVPTYTIHRDKEVWGEDADEFRPERWFERDREAMSKAYNPFSTGPRACLGRNLAVMELQILLAVIFWRFDMVLEAPEMPLKTREGFLRKPYGCMVGIQRRNA